MSTHFMEVNVQKLADAIVELTELREKVATLTKERDLLSNKSLETIEEMQQIGELVRAYRAKLAKAQEKEEKGVGE